MSIRTLLIVLCCVGLLMIGLAVGARLIEWIGIHSTLVLADVFTGFAVGCVVAVPLVVIFDILDRWLCGGDE